jgi:hypothetical protein
MTTGDALHTGRPAVTAGVRHRSAAVAAGVMALAASSGAIGLIGGSLDLGSTVNNRLPLRSPVLGGVALLLIVAVPMALAAVAAWRGAPGAPTLLLLAGTALVSWILVEIAFIRTFAWLQPVCGSYGLLVAALGWHAGRTAR